MPQPFAPRGAALALLLGASSACARPSSPAAPAPASGRATAPAEVDLVVAATTDVHGRVRAWDYFANAADPQRGLTRAATVIDSVRAANPGRVVLVDAGDLLQGNPFTYVAARVAPDEPHPVIAAMNALGYDAAAVGNHEFNYGVPTLGRAASQARFPFLAANARRADGAPAFRAWTMVERQGVRVAIVGGTTPGSMVWDRDNLRGRLTIGDIVPAVRAAVAEARGAGADVVVAVLHSGLDEPASYDTVSTGLPSENVAARVAREVPGIDVVVFGHSHKELADTIIGGALVMQPKNWATSVAVAHLALARDGGRWRVASRRATLVRAAGHPESPAILAATQAAHDRAVAYATTPIGSTPTAWRADSSRVVDTPLIDFILEVERRATGAQLASTAAFSLDASLDSGAVTVARIAALYPYDNTLRVIKVSGAQLRQYLEASSRYYRTLDAATAGQGIVDQSVPGYNFDVVAGVDYALDLSRPIGERVTKLAYQGRPVAATDSFTLALNNYRQTGGGGFAMLATAPLLDDRNLEIRQLLIDEVKRVGVLRPGDYFHRNWELLPAAAVSRAYAEMNRGVARRNAGGPSGAAAGIAGAQAPFAGPRLRIVAVNDFHGALDARPDASGARRGGAGALAATVRRAVNECRPPECRAVVLDGGDEFQGTPASNLAYGRTVVPLFVRMGVAAAALGNHEFDWGQDTLRARMRQAPYAFLAANARTTGGRDVDWISDDTIVVRGTTRIGVIGVATVETKTTTKTQNTVGLEFVDPAPIVDSLSVVLRRQGAEAVIVIAHAGAFCSRDGASSCEGEIVRLAQRLTQPIDAIVSGHTHSLVDTEVKGIPIVQARSRGQAVAVVDLPLRAPGATQSAASTTDDRRAVGQVREVYTDSVAPDSVALRIAENAQADVAARVNRIVARIAADMPIREAGNEVESALGNLVADAMRAAGKVDAAFMNHGGLRAPLRAGVATYGSLFEVEPFGNLLTRVDVRGRDLRDWLERRLARGTPDVYGSGLRVEYDSTRTVGSRVVRVTIGGAPLVDARVYSVVVNDFMATGAQGFGNVAVRTRPAESVDLDALVAYVARLPQPVQPPADHRFVPVTAR